MAYLLNLIGSIRSTPRYQNQSNALESSLPTFMLTRIFHASRLSQIPRKVGERSYPRKVIDVCKKNENSMISAKKKRKTQYEDSSQVTIGAETFKQLRDNF